MLQYTDEEDDSTTGCLFEYPYVKENWKLIVMDLRKQQALDADPKVNAANKFYRKSKHAGNATMFFVVEEKLQRNYSWLLTKNCKRIVNAFHKFI